MINANLETTDWLLGVMAVVSLLEAVALIGAVVMGYRLYSRLMATVKELDERRVAPLMAQVNEILADVKGVTARVHQQTARVDSALTGTIDRVDETAERVKTNLRANVNRAIGVVKGIRAAIESLFVRETPPHPPAEFAGRA